MREDDIGSGDKGDLNSEHCNPLRAILTFLQTDVCVENLQLAMEKQNSLCGRLSVFCSLYNTL